MTLRPELRRALQALIGDVPLTYVDGGARKGRLPSDFRAVRGSRYVGFEADEAECARLSAGARPDHVYIPAFLGQAREERTFNMTASAACSSLLPPDEAFLAPFGEISTGFRVERRLQVQTVPLDECLPAHGVDQADFLKLDTQGSELDILRGAGRTLDTQALGVQVEVEFAPMYVGQPLFADVDAFLRTRGFVLFDLSRYRVRRPTVARSVPTRGQLLWGHALYLKAADALDEARRARLAAVAIILGFPDLAAGILLDLERSASNSMVTRAASRARSILDTPPAAGLLGHVLERLAQRPRDVSCDRDLWRD